MITAGDGVKFLFWCSAIINMFFIKQKTQVCLSSQRFFFQRPIQEFCNEDKKRKQAERFLFIITKGISMGGNVCCVQHRDVVIERFLVVIFVRSEFWNVFYYLWKKNKVLSFYCQSCLNAVLMMLSSLRPGAVKNTTSQVPFEAEFVSGCSGIIYSKPNCTMLKREKEGDVRNYFSKYWTVCRSVSNYNC